MIGAAGWHRLYVGHDLLDGIDAPLFQFALGQRSCPAIEDLHCICAGIELGR